MDKQILKDYIDACELVKETEQDIQRLERKKKIIVQGSVKGSNPDYPYQPQNFHIEGAAFTYSDDTQLRMEERLLVERKERAEKTKAAVETWLNTIPLRMQRIVRYRLFEGLSWEATADKLGKKVTGESVRKELERFLEKN